MIIWIDFFLLKHKKKNLILKIESKETHDLFLSTFYFLEGDMKTQLKRQETAHHA